MRQANVHRMVVPSPLHGWLAWISGGLDRALIGFSQLILRHSVFYPFRLSLPAYQLFDFSRNLAIAASSVFIIIALIQSQWPELQFQRFGLSPVIALHRSLAQIVWVLMAVPLVNELLQFNNAVVSLLTAHATVTLHFSSNLALLTNPIIVAVLTAAIVALAFMLGIYYFIRNIEIVVLLALVPWFGLFWMIHTHTTALANLLKELLIAIFIQSLQAMVFYLFVHMLAYQSGSVVGQLQEIALLYYMVKLPSQVRRIVGAVGPSS